MLTGISALNTLNSSLQTVRNEINRIDHELSELTNQLASNRRLQAQTLQKTAAIRLDSIAQRSLREALTAADQQALNFLDQRQQELVSIEQNIIEINEQLASTEAQRQITLDNSNHIAQQIIDKEASIQKQLEQDPLYNTALTEARTADAIADEAERKAQQSSDDLGAKGEPYVADPLFMYLWDRNFGTPGYANRNFLSRFLDSWVAKLIRYEPARINYWNIQEIPKRLEQHAKSIREAANNTIENVRNLELEALQQGGATELQQQLEQIRSELEEEDNELAVIEDRLNKILAQRAQFASAKDPYMQQCLQILSNALEHKSLQALRQSVRATASSQDDALVDQLYEFQSNYQDIEDDLHDVRKLHDSKLARLRELEVVRRNFKQHRFDDVRSGFGNEALISSVLTQFLQGLVNGGELWRVLQRNQRHRDVGAWPDYGSGGLGNGSVWGDIWGNSLPRNNRNSRRSRSTNRSNNSPWHWPNSNNGGFRLPSGRSSSGGSRPSSGGFKTGGGF